MKYCCITFTSDVDLKLFCHFLKGKIWEIQNSSKEILSLHCSTRLQNNEQIQRVNNSPTSLARSRCLCLQTFWQLNQFWIQDSRWQLLQGVTGFRSQRAICPFKGVSIIVPNFKYFKSHKMGKKAYTYGHNPPKYLFLLYVCFLRPLLIIHWGQSYVKATCNSHWFHISVSFETHSSNLFPELIWQVHFVQQISSQGGSMTIL